MNLYLAIYKVGKGNSTSTQAFRETEEYMRRNGVELPWEGCEVISFDSEAASRFHHEISTSPAAANVYANPAFYHLVRNVGGLIITGKDEKRFCEQVADNGDCVLAFQNMILKPLVEKREGNKVGVYVTDSMPKDGIPNNIDFGLLRSPTSQEYFLRMFPTFPEDHVFSRPLIPEPIASMREVDYKRRKGKGTKGSLDIVLNPSGSGISYDGIPLMTSLLPLLKKYYSLAVIGPRPPFNRQMVEYARQYCRDNGLKDPVECTTYRKPEQRQVIFVTNDDMMTLGKEGITAISNSDLVISPPNETPFWADHDCCPTIIYPPDRGLHETKNREEAERRKTVYVLRGSGKQVYLTCGDQIRRIQEQGLLDQMVENCHTYSGPYTGNEEVVRFVAKMIQK